MKPARNPITDEHELYERALKLLTQKSRSRWEMHRLLAKRCEQQALINAVLDKCIAHGYLDDVKYALQLARHHVERKRQGRRRVAQELRARGLSDPVVEGAIEEVFGPVDETTLLRRALEAKLKSASRAWDAKKTKKVYDQLVRAGFNTDLILRELRRFRAPVPENMDTSAPDE